MLWSFDCEMKLVFLLHCDYQFFINVAIEAVVVLSGF